MSPRLLSIQKSPAHPLTQNTEWGNPQDPTKFVYSVATCRGSSGRTGTRIGYAAQATWGSVDLPPTPRDARTWSGGTRERRILHLTQRGPASHCIEPPDFTLSLRDPLELITLSPLGLGAYLDRSISYGALWESDKEPPTPQSPPNVSFASLGETG